MPRYMLALLTVGVLASPVDRVFALPVEIGPEVTSRVERQELPEDETTYQGDRELRRAVLSEGAMTALIVSDLRNIELANGSRKTAPRSSQGADRDSRGSADPGAYLGDPLEFILRKVVPVSGARGPAPGTRQVPSSRFEDGSGAPLLEEDKEVLARLAAGREILLRAAEWVISPELTEEGKRGFSILGVGGFTVERNSGQTRVAFRDIGLVSQNAAQRVSAGRPNGSGPDGSARWEDEYERNALLKFWFLVWDVLTHPLGIAVLIVAGFARLLVGVVDRRPAHGEMVAPTATVRVRAGHRRR